MTQLTYEVVCDKLGIEHTTDQSTILAALDHRLQAQADAYASKRNKHAVQAFTAESIPEGTVLMDKAALEQLQAQAALLDKHEHAQAARRRDGIITQAMREGKVTPASRDRFRIMLDIHEDNGKAIIDQLPVVVNLTERGTGVDPWENYEAPASNWKQPKRHY